VLRGASRMTFWKILNCLMLSAYLG